MLKNTLDNMIKSNKSSSAILRQLINGLNLEPNDFANSNAETLCKKYPIIDKACRGKLSEFLSLVLKYFN